MDRQRVEEECQFRGRNWKKKNEMTILMKGLEKVEWASTRTIPYRKVMRISSI
jgi:hypothetical protein